MKDDLSTVIGCIDLKLPIGLHCVQRLISTYKDIKYFLKTFELIAFYLKKSFKIL